MDCCCFSRNESQNNVQDLPNFSSPEMFNSDNEDDKVDEGTLTSEPTVTVSLEKPSQADLITKSDNNLLTKITKYLSGVPPPPKFTICRTDCTELLLRIYENQHLFWTSNVLPQKELQHEHKENISTNSSYQCNKSTPRNLSTVFDACDPLYQNNVSNNVAMIDVQSKICSDNDRLEQVVSKNENSQFCAEINVTKDLNSENRLASTNGNKTNMPSTEKEPFFYYTVNEEQASTLAWPEAYHHKFHGIHYNTNKSIEEFENLMPKLCERYIGAETQSTCTVWFSKQAPGSAKKRSLAAKRDNGQSPGKRLNHLTRRRRTFSSANLQGLALNNKKLVVLNIKKPSFRKGKSPRGKSPRGKSPWGRSPRGKSPRGTPKSSTKKRVARRLVLDGPSPLKSKIETSKRALFQSPPPDSAGPSKMFLNGPNNVQSIKRALFTQSTKENDFQNVRNVVEESRKRKNEEELEGPRFKWPKSLSFDCAHELHNNTTLQWERHSSSNIIEKNKLPVTEGRTELSDTHRKKLLWAVAEALRSKGIGMTHPQFKQYASNLARTIRKSMPDLENKNIPRIPGSTSDRMLKLAKHHVVFIVDATPSD